MVTSWLCWLLTIRYFGFFIETQKIKFISNKSVYAKSQSGINFGSRSLSNGVHSILNTTGYIPDVFILIYNKSHPGSCMSVNQCLGWRVYVKKPVKLSPPGTESTGDSWSRWRRTLHPSKGGAKGHTFPHREEGTGKNW